PVEKGPTSLGFADHPTAPFTLLPRNSQPLLGIVRNGCSGSVGTTARDQSVRVLGINWNSCSGSLGAPTPRRDIAMAKHKLKDNVAQQSTPGAAELNANMDIIVKDNRQIIEIQFINNSLIGLTLVLNKG